MQKAMFGALLLSGMLSVGLASAGSIVTLGCEEGAYEQKFSVGSGKMLSRYGLALKPFFCSSSRTMTTHLVVINPRNADRLAALAALPNPDPMLLSDYWKGADAQSGEDEALFGSPPGWTFANIRKVVAEIARPLPEKIDDSSFVFYTHASCDVPLIPADYYLETEKPFPLCRQGTPLKHLARPDSDVMWD